MNDGLLGYSIMEVYACGFNGFQQISQIIDTDHPGNPSRSKGDVATSFYATPVKLKTKSNTPCKQHCLVTWSKLLFMQQEDDSNVIAATWNNTLLRNKEGTHFLGTSSENVDSKQEIQTTSSLYHIIGGEQHFYCLHDKGNLSQLILDDSPRVKTPEYVDDHPPVLLRSIFTASPVTDVSCGKEHVLFLTGRGQVFSFGLGSRGQLGHNSVEEEKSPRQVEVLDGLTVVAVAAGGWHSAVVTASGDLFTWGWNESGQLGHAPRDTPRDLHSQIPESHLDKVPDTDNGAFDGSRDTSDSSSPPHEPNVEGGHSGKEDPSNVEGGHSAKENPPSCTGSVSEEANTVGVTDVTVTGVVTLVSSPLLVTSLPDDYTAIHVSCGSRHTAVVTDEDKLYTTGWNKYGQLCLGHTKGTDSFTAVHFSKGKVKDVLCGFWNTVIFANKNY